MNSLILALLLNALFTAAWLYWCFRGEVRHMLAFYVFPTSWRPEGVTAEEFMTLSQEEFDTWVSAECDAPHLVRSWLGCTGCMSAWIAAAGSFLALVTGVSPLALPILWPASAWLGLLLHKKIL